MALVEGPFDSVKFLGASVTSVDASNGWNEQSSTVSFQLVEDPDDGDVFEKPDPGLPRKFELGEFRFEGIVQRWLQKESLDGCPVYELTMTDPREILGGIQVIIGAYSGTMDGFPNLLNAFGYYENLYGWGGSLVNESGMVWNTPMEILNMDINQGGVTIDITPGEYIGIMPAIQKLTANGNAYGGPVQFHGYSYKIDLSNLPLPPPYYRLGGSSLSVLDMVNEICQDGGHDYICYLEGDTIKFKTVSRVLQPVIGQIGTYVTSQPECSSRNYGLELRNDITNAVLLGGDIHILHQMYNFNYGDTIWPFWGFDIFGNVVLGEGVPELEEHWANLNSAMIADVTGSYEYPCSITELRCALEDFDTWAAYVLRWEQEKADIIGVVGAIDSHTDLNEYFPASMFIRDMIESSDRASYFLGRINDSDFWSYRVQNTYEHIKKYATDFLGSRFLVRIPYFIYWKYEPETTHRISSHEPTDAGYAPEGTFVMGLDYLNEHHFLTTDGRFECFARFDNWENIDLSRIPPDAAILQENGLFVKASVDQQIGVVYPPGSMFPYCVVNLATPVYAWNPTPIGDIDEIAAILDCHPDRIRQACRARHGSFPVRPHPAPFRPDAIALPMKSNRDSYGPWGTFPPWGQTGIPGKVHFEKDDSLTPWNYGGYDLMNQAAMSKLVNASTNMQMSETGSVEKAGTPDVNLGDALIAGGPNVTGINLSISTSGVTTSYSMQTFTPMYGQFAKNNADRIRRLGTAAMDLRRQMRVLFHQRRELSNIFYNTQWGQRANYLRGTLGNYTRGVRQQTPHDVLLGTITHDEKYGYRTQVSTQTPPEVVANSQGDEPETWVLNAVMGLEGLLRPFSTNRLREQVPGPADMPHYETVDDDIFGDGTVTRWELDPFADTADIDLAAWGDEYPGSLHTLKPGKDGALPEWDNMRLIGLRGPLVLVGWGYEYTGKPVPNSADPDKLIHEWTQDFAENHRTHIEKWKAGPIGLYWDDWRKIWTIPTFLFGTLDSVMTSSGTWMTITVGNQQLPDKVKVYNWFGKDSELKTGTRVCAAYYQQENKWWVISAQCPP